MNKTRKALSEGGKKGQRARMKTIKLRRYELITELSGLIDKHWLEYIQFSRRRWTDNDLQELINYFRNEKNT